MAYENVNVSKLKGSLQKIGSIKTNKNELKKVSNELNAGNWSENSRVRIKQAIEKTSEIYEKIEKYIENCKQAANYIEQYQELDRKSREYQSKIDNNKYKIRRAQEDEDTSSYEKEVNSYNASISNNNSRKIALKQKINDLIS